MECYEILGCSVDATQEQIKKAYHAKALLHHPDRKAHAKKDGTFSKISHAFGILSDKRKRGEYDAARNLGRHAAFIDEETKSTKLTELEGNENFRALQWMKRVDDKQYILRHLGKVISLVYNRTPILVFDLDTRLLLRALGSSVSHAHRCA